MSSRCVIPIVLTAACWGVPSLVTKAASYHPGNDIVMGDIGTDTEMVEVKQARGSAVTTRVVQQLNHEMPQEPVPIIQPDPRETFQERLLALKEGLQQWLETVFRDLTV